MVLQHSTQMDYPQNPNYNYPHIDTNYFMDLWPLADPFQLSDDLMFGDFPEQSAVSSEQNVVAETSTIATSTNTNKCKKGSVKKEKVTVSGRVAFRTKSEVEIMDDGFKWRKYGKKSVKNSPNPRNYYKCTIEGCNVKKRVERDKADSRYVITTYEGIHIHESPTGFYYNHLPIMVPNVASTLQAPFSSPHSSSSS